MALFIFTSSLTFAPKFNTEMVKDRYTDTRVKGLVIVVTNVRLSNCYCHGLTVSAAPLSHLVMDIS